jgi:hypothetical protein
VPEWILHSKYVLPPEENPERDLLSYLVDDMTRIMLRSIKIDKAQGGLYGAGRAALGR